MYLVEQIKFAS